MGTLLSALSTRLCVQREDFPKTLRHVKALAKETPGELAFPAEVLKAKSLDAALKATWWEPRLDQHGDLVGVHYIADKAPPDATDDCSLFRALAKTAVFGEFLIFLDGELASRVTAKHGKLWDGYGIPEAVHQRIAAAGETVHVSVPVYVSPPENEPLRLVARVNGYEADPATVARIQHSISTGGERKTLTVTIELAPEARGFIGLTFSGASSSYCAAIIELEIKPPADASWDVVGVESTFAPRRAILRKTEAKRALIQAQRFAIRNATKPGSDFLAAVVKATSLDEVMTAAGLTGRLTEQRCTLALVANRLPGAEPLFSGLLEAMSYAASDDPRSQTADLSLRYAHSPDLIYSYRVGARGGRRIYRAT